MRKIWFGPAFAAFAATIAQHQHRPRTTKRTLSSARKSWDYSSTPTLRDYTTAVRCVLGMPTPKLKRRHSAIVSPGKRIAQVTHPPRGRREFHGDRGGSNQRMTSGPRLRLVARDGMRGSMKPSGRMPEREHSGSK
jgi:hypothetical protein